MCTAPGREFVTGEIKKCRGDAEGSRGGARPGHVERGGDDNFRFHISEIKKMIMNVDGSVPSCQYLSTNKRQIVFDDRPRDVREPGLALN